MSNTITHTQCGKLLFSLQRTRDFNWAGQTTNQCVHGTLDYDTGRILTSHHWHEKHGDHPHPYDWLVGIQSEIDTILLIYGLPPPGTLLNEFGDKEPSA